jgi:curli production assembly/transport component CsgF
MRLCNKLTIIIAFVLSSGSANASALVYTPVDPAFGGSPFNSAYLLGVAGAINGYQPPSAANGVDQGALFVQELQGQLLGALSTQITNIIFGPNAAPSGQVVFGDQTIAFTRSTGSVNLTISNSTTGAVTQISIPTLLTSTSSSGTGN